MDAFLAICQGLGLALAAGLAIGVVVPPIMPGWGAAVGAAPLGVLACLAALSGADEPAWPAVPVGALAGALAALVVRDVVAGAARRQGEDPSELSAGQPGTLTAIVIVAAVLVALLSLLLPPVSLIVLGALAWLATARRRRAGRKYEGLRVLR
jgi:hypothetical protein